MKRSLVIKGLTLILIIFIFGFSAMGCELIDKIINKDDNTVDDGGDNGNETAVDKAALEAELALEIAAQGDYTTDSYNTYLAKLEAAKNIATDETATQDDVDEATAELSAARLALSVRPVEAVKGADRNIILISGESKDITLSDYINTNSLGNITYKVQASNDIADISPVADGKFTITAGEVIGEADVKVSINVYYNGKSKLTVELILKITNEVSPTLNGEEFTKVCDLATLGDKDKIVLDFAENVNNISHLSLNYSVKWGNEELTLDGTYYTFALGSYTEETVCESFEVTISFSVNGEEKTLQYTYKLALRDTGAYSIANGNFENGLDGWTLTTTVGDAPFGGIDNKTHYWIQNFPMNNVGSYFSAYADGVSEASRGTLASPYFIVKSEYATYMLGGAGNPDVYITVENKDGEVLALYRNTMFCDLPEGLTDFNEQRELIGKSVFLANFVTYKVSMADFMGQEVRFVIHDYASENWGVVFFDELVTYYASEEELPEGAVLGENLLADKNGLMAEIFNAVKEQGDYTTDSYNAYFDKIVAAQLILDDIAVSQENVDRALAELIDARNALTVKPIDEIDGANKFFRLTSGNSKEITLSDYINTNGLGNITYAIKANSVLLTIGSVVNGKFTVTAGEVSETTAAALYITVCYSGEEKLTVELSLQITNDLAPILFGDEVVKEYDLYELNNKTGIALDLSENVDNIGNIALSYSVNGRALDGSVYTFTFGSYTDKLTYESITVTVSYTANGEAKSVSYIYKLGLKDTTDYRLANGGFENGLDGWTVVGNIGSVSSDKNYWLNDPEVAEGFEFGMDGNNMFSAYAPGALESAVGTLTSSTFKVGGSCFVTFKVGAMRDANYVYVDVVDANTKQILARYYNSLWADRTDGLKSGCTLVSYKADLSAFEGREVFFRISDNADSGYGLFFADSFVTYYESEPDGFNTATPVDYQLPATVYDLFNGGFEMGDVQGWWNIGEIGVVTSADGYWKENIYYNKNGLYLFTGVESFGADTMREGNRGSLTSSIFEIGGTGYISFMLGGGENVLCYVQVIDAVTGEILARYHQQDMDGAVLVQYVADLSAYIGRSARIQVVDMAENGWGCVSFDNVVTYYTSINSLPDGIAAIDIKVDLKYSIENGSFESGNLDGWSMNITEEGAHNTLGWVLDEEIDVDWYAKNDDTKDGNYIFTFVQPGDVNCESSKGALQSSTFSLKQGAFVSFKFGGAGNHRNHDVYIELCRADGSVIARFYNDAEGKINTKMNAYYYQYDGAEVECFFRVVDNSTADYGCFVVDDFRVNLECAPEGYIAAIQ